MSDKPAMDRPVPSYGSDDNTQRQQSGAMQQDADRGETEQDTGLKPALQRARHALEEGVERQAQHLQERARNTGEQISEALGAAAQTLSSDQSWLAGPAQDLAQSVRRLTAQGLGSPAEMKTRVTNFARRHPAWALAGAVAVGFAAARFFKTTSAASDSDEHRFVDREEKDEETGRAERPDAVPGVETGGQFYG